MRSKLATLALAGTLGLSGVATAALAAPVAAYAATGDSTALAERVTELRTALEGLVTDGTLTQAQADRVASTVAEARPEGGHGRHGGPGGRGGPGARGVDLSAAATALGLTEQELRAAGEAGTTLGELAEQERVGEDTLVAALVAAEEARLAKGVSAGRLTQAQADERLAGAEERITSSLDQPVGGGRRGPGGRDGAAPSTSSTPSAAPSTSASGGDA